MKKHLNLDLRDYLVIVILLSFAEIGLVLEIYQLGTMLQTSIWISWRDGLLIFVGSLLGACIIINVIFSIFLYDHDRTEKLKKLQRLVDKHKDSVES